MVQGDTIIDVVLVDAVGEQATLWNDVVISSLLIEDDDVLRIVIGIIDVKILFF